MDNLTVVVPFYNGHQYIHKLLNTLPFDLPLIIVDDLSDNPISHIDRPNTRYIRLDKKGYFAGAVNRGIQECNTDVLVLNQDTWFENLEGISLVEQHRDKFAFIGERIRGNHPSFGELGYIHGTFMFMRRDAIRSVGLLNDNDYPLWGNTAEWQWRTSRKGFQVLPLKEVPGFRHARKETERYGSSIKNLVENSSQFQKEKFISTPPLISVIVPCYNYGRYIEDCINSLIGGQTSLGEMPGQTLQSFEIIIVDDASTDNSASYIKKVADVSKGIRAFQLTRNVGTARTLNFGIEKAVGKYITFLSADDMRESFSLEKLYRACEANPHSFAYDDVWIFNTSGRAKQWQIQEYDFEKLIWKNQIPAGIMYPKTAWKEVGGYPAIMGDGREDWAFNVALGIHGWCGVHVKEFGYLYRREGQNRTEQNTTQEHMRIFLGKMQSLFPEIYRGERPMACCGKGSSSNKAASASQAKKTALFSSAGVASRATNFGATGMKKIKYIGNQMEATWVGQVSHVSYSFGKDRPQGYIDARDLGSRDSSKGFLGLRDKYSGAWLFEEVRESKSEPEVVAVQLDTESESKKEEKISSSDKATVEVAETKTPVSSKVKKSKYDPENMTVEEIRNLEGKNLTLQDWEEIYRLEMAGRNRKSAVNFLEDKVANWKD